MEREEMILQAEDAMKVAWLLTHQRETCQAFGFHTAHEDNNTAELMGLG